MKIIYNDIIPFQGFKAINLFGILFARKEAKIGERINDDVRKHGKNIWDLFSGSMTSLPFRSGVVVYTGQQWVIFT